MTGERDYNQLSRELKNIQRAIEELTPLRSRWNGILRLETVEGERGSKSFTCAITLRPDIATSPLRWRTLIHEMFHACSVGLQVHDFNAWRGWEEGVVEQLSRLYRKPILERLGVEVDWEELERLDHAHPFNGYIAALETIRTEITAAEPEFYIELLQVPIRERYITLVRGALQLEAEPRRRTLAALSAARFVLERNVP